MATNSARCSSERHKTCANTARAHCFYPDSFLHSTMCYERTLQRMREAPLRQHSFVRYQTIDWLSNDFDQEGLYLARALGQLYSTADNDPCASHDVESLPLMWITSGHLYSTPLSRWNCLGRSSVTPELPRTKLTVPLFFPSSILVILCSWSGLF